jgi:hypothetical protein
MALCLGAGIAGDFEGFVAVIFEAEQL